MTAIDLTTVPEAVRPLLEPGLSERDVTFLAQVEAAARDAVTQRSISGREAAERAQRLLEAAEDYARATPRSRFLAGEHLRSLWPEAPGEAWYAAMDAEESRRTAKAAHLREAASIYLDALTLR